MTDSVADASLSDPLSEQEAPTQSLSEGAAVLRSGPNAASIVFSALESKDFSRALKEAQALTDEQIVGARSSSSFGLQHAAALKGHIELLQHVVAHGADVNALFPGGHWTPLLLGSGRSAMVEVLLALGADANQSAPNGLSPLTVALSQNNLESARQLVAAGANPAGPAHATWPPLFSAAGFPSDAALNYLGELGVDFSFRAPTGRSALHQAAAHGSADSVLFLAKQSVGLDWADREGSTALHLAASNNNVNTVAALLQLGAHPNLENQDGKVPSELASDVDGVASLLKQAETTRTRVLNASAPKKKTVPTTELDLEPQSSKAKEEKSKAPTTKKSKAVAVKKPSKSASKPIASDGSTNGSNSTLPAKTLRKKAKM